MNITKEEYKILVADCSPRSKPVKDMIMAFIFGGIICAIGQLIGNLYKSTGLEETQAATATSMTLIFLGALLTGLGVYDRLAKVAGAGTLVPITGFANSVASPAIEYRSEGFVLGMSGKMFTIAGPVLVFGISASVIWGIILMIFKG